MTTWPPPLTAWLSQGDMQTQVARELLRREMDNWRTDRKLLISARNAQADPRTAR